MALRRTRGIQINSEELRINNSEDSPLLNLYLKAMISILNKKGIDIFEEEITEEAKLLEDSIKIMDKLVE